MDIRKFLLFYMFPLSVYSCREERVERRKKNGAESGEMATQDDMVRMITSFRVEVITVQIAKIIRWVSFFILVLYACRLN